MGQLHHQAQHRQRQAVRRRYQHLPERYLPGDAPAAHRRPVAHPGARVSNYRYRYDLSTQPNKIPGNRESGVVTPYAGVVYALNDIHSVYASYTSIFKPQTVRDASGATLAPREGDNYEVGLKSEYFDGRLQTSVAAFEIKQDNLAVVDPGRVVPGTTTAAYEAISGATTRGFEVEASGELQPGWNLSASYNHSIIKDATASASTRCFRPTWSSCGPPTACRASWTA